MNGLKCHGLTRMRIVLKSTWTQLSQLFYFSTCQSSPSVKSEWLCIANCITCCNRLLTSSHSFDFFHTCFSLLKDQLNTRLKSTAAALLKTLGVVQLSGGLCCTCNHTQQWCHGVFEYTCKSRSQVEACNFQRVLSYNVVGSFVCSWKDFFCLGFILLPDYFTSLSVFPL